MRVLATRVACRSTTSASSRMSLTCCSRSTPFVPRLDLRQCRGDHKGRCAGTTTKHACLSFAWLYLWPRLQLSACALIRVDVSRDMIVLPIVVGWKTT
jgi:hypothetical protein